MFTCFRSPISPLSWHWLFVCIGAVCSSSARMQCHGLPLTQAVVHLQRCVWQELGVERMRAASKCYTTTHGELSAMTRLTLNWRMWFVKNWASEGPSLGHTVPDMEREQVSSTNQTHHSPCPDCLSVDCHKLKSWELGIGRKYLWRCCFKKWS